jgi:hypothetical protein
MLFLSCNLRGFMCKIHNSIFPEVEVFEKWKSGKFIYTMCINNICWRAYGLLGCFRNKPPRQLRGLLLFHNIFKRMLHSFCYESVVVVEWGF